MSFWFGFALGVVLGWGAWVVIITGVEIAAMCRNYGSSGGPLWERRRT